MNNHTLIIGNLVRYRGTNPNYSRKLGQILKIDKTFNHQSLYHLRICGSQNEYIEITVHESEIDLITLEEDHLIKLGFLKSDLDIFSLEDIVIFRPRFEYHERNGSSYVDRGFVVVEKNIPIPIKESDIDTFTSPVTFLHSLQNYLQGKLVKVIDWSMFIS